METKLGYLTKHYPVNIERYEKQKSILGKRNSFSKTDPDANFMRVKAALELKIIRKMASSNRLTIFRYPPLTSSSLIAGILR